MVQDTDCPSDKAEPSRQSLAGGHRLIISSLDEFRVQTVAVTRLAERSLVIYTGNLDPEIYGHPAFIEALKRLVLARPFARVRLLIAEAGDSLDAKHPLMTIATRLPAMVELRMMPPNQYDASGFIVADECAVVYRMHCTRWDGIAELHDTAVAKMYLAKFERVWAGSSPIASDDSELDQSA